MAIEHSYRKNVAGTVEAPEEFVVVFYERGRISIFNLACAERTAALRGIASLLEVAAKPTATVQGDRASVG